MRVTTGDAVRCSSEFSAYCAINIASTASPCFAVSPVIGKKGEIHSAELLRLVANLPIVIEFFDEPAVVEATLEALHDLVPPGHLVSWRTRYRIEDTPPRKPAEKNR